MIAIRMLHRLIALTAAMMAISTQLVGQSIRLGEATVLIAGDNPVVTLDRSARVAISGTGTVAVADGTGAFVGVLVEGRAVRRIGRSGNGPGEFRGGLQAGWLGDTLWVVDRGSRRITLVVDGRPRASSPFVGTGVTAYLLEPPVALTPTGAVVTGVPVRTGTANGAGSPTPIFLTDRRGQKIRDTLFVVPPGPPWITIRLPNRNLTMIQPFAVSTLYAVSGTGSYLVRVDPGGTRGMSGLGVSVPTVTLSTTEGRQRYARPVAGTPVAVSNRLVDSVVKQRVDTLNQHLRRAEVRESDFRRQLYVPSHYPMATAAIVANDGTVYLRGNDWGVRQVTYSVLSPTGDLRGAFQVPTTQHLVAADGDRVFSVRETDDGAFELISQRLR